MQFKLFNAITMHNSTEKCPKKIQKKISFKSKNLTFLDFLLKIMRFLLKIMIFSNPGII